MRTVPTSKGTACNRSHRRSEAEIGSQNQQCADHRRKAREGAVAAIHGDDAYFAKHSLYDYFCDVCDRLRFASAVRLQYSWFALSQPIHRMLTHFVENQPSAFCVSAVAHLRLHHCSRLLTSACRDPLVLIWLQEIYRSE